jgi:hypothetical protein
MVELAASIEMAEFLSPLMEPMQLSRIKVSMIILELVWMTWVSLLFILGMGTGYPLSKLY